MKIQLLTFPGCPNAGPARAAVQRALALERISACIDEIDVTAADAPSWAKQWGSPTILIDGADVAGAVPSPTGTSCRLYAGGAPSVDLIRARLAPAPARTHVALIAGIVTAVAASACCLVPAALAIVGLSGAAVASALAPARPYFLVLAAAALATGFYLAYRPSRGRADCGCAAPRRRRWSRVGLWGSAVVIIGIAGYPVVLDRTASAHGPSRGVATTRLHITGMDCAACTKPLAQQLAHVRGVATVDIDFDRELAIVTHDGKRALDRELVAIVEDAGYEATVLR